MMNDLLSMSVLLLRFGFGFFFLKNKRRGASMRDVLFTGDVAFSEGEFWSANEVESGD